MNCIPIEEQPTFYLLWLAFTRTSTLLATLFFIVLGFLIRFIYFRLSLEFGTQTRKFWMTPDTSITIDSGASGHCCYDRSRLMNYQKYLLPIKVEVVGGTNTWIVGAGDMKITSILPNGSKQKIVLEAVQHIPSCNFTLLSTRKLGLQGIYYSSERQILYSRNPITQARVVLGTVEASKVTGLPMLKTAEVPQVWCRLL